MNLSGKRLGWRNIGKRYVLNAPHVLKYVPAVRRAYPHTMQKFPQLCQVIEAIDDLAARSVEGAIVEMGCWRGGCGALMSWAAKRGGIERTTWLFDSFEGLPEPTEEDRRGNMKEEGEVEAGNFRATRKDVERALEAVGPHGEVRIMEGWFDETVPKAKDAIGKIALLRLDGDIYESTLYCLRELYPLVADGGIVIIDDYRNWIGCRRALYRYFADEDVSPYLQSHPYGGRTFFVKGR